MRHTGECDNGSIAAMLVVGALLWTAACQQPAPVRELMPSDGGENPTWDEVFVEREISLQMPEGDSALQSLGDLLVAADGSLLAPDGRRKRILVFNSEGTFIRQIQGGDTGSFELSVLGKLALDPEGNLLVYDPDGRWVTVLAQHTYRVVRRFQLSAPLSAMVALSDGSLVTYFANGKKVFRKFDPSGKEVASAQDAGESAFRIFHGRVQTGGIAQSSDGSIFGIHPSAFQLVRLSPDLRVLELQRGSEGDPWAPRPPAFPPDLNPYDYQVAHEEWWDSFLHIGRPFSLGQDLLLVTLFRSRGLSEAENFANLYHTGGTVLAEGLRVPREGRIVGTASGRMTVYVARSARLGNDGTIEPMTLHEYRLQEAWR